MGSSVFLGSHRAVKTYPTWRPRGLSKLVISRVVIIGVSPFRVLIAYNFII